jgi:hypothetical protein
VRGILIEKDKVDGQQDKGEDSEEDGGIIKGAYPARLLMSESSILIHVFDEVAADQPEIDLDAPFGNLMSHHHAQGQKDEAGNDKGVQNDLGHGIPQSCRVENVPYITSLARISLFRFTATLMTKYA